MNQDPRKPSPSEATLAPDPAAGSGQEIEETLAFLDCQGSASADVFRAAALLTRRASRRRSPLFLVLRHLEEIDGSLTGFVLGLEAILRKSRVPVVLGDPSGIAALVLSMPAVNPTFRLAAPSGAAKRVSILHPSPSAASALEGLLGAFGHATVLAHSVHEARRAGPGGAPDLILLDLDFPHLQSFALADLMRRLHPRATLVGLTAREEVWTPENSRRYGFRRILSKPYSATDILGAVAEAR